MDARRSCTYREAVRVIGLGLVCVVGCTPASTAPAAESSPSERPPPSFAELEPERAAAWYGALDPIPRPSEDEIVPVSRSLPRRLAKNPAPSAEQPEVPLSWKQANVAELRRYWRELQCMHLVISNAGNTWLASGDAHAWETVSTIFVAKADDWLEAISAPEPRMPGWVSEAHELLRFSYPSAYQDRDAAVLDAIDFLWAYTSRDIGSNLHALDGDPAVVEPTNPEDRDACREFLDSL